MLEVHRCRQIEWSPSAVVALATSVNGAAVAAARENGAIEIWNVAAGSVGWHCQLRIPGRQDAVISSLVWCQSQEEDASPLGRLFSAGLDGFVTEWDLHTLLPKAVVESMGGSVWQLAAEHMVSTPKGLDGTPKVRSQVESESEDDGNSSSSDSDDEPERREQRVALACEDGCIRVFEVGDGHQGMVYRRSFPRVKGRILSVAWSWDGVRLVAGGSDGCIRCWDVATTREVYRITAGIGGKGIASDFCIWSLLVLRNGDIVSGDSSGSTQFWDGQLGTLLQAQTRHGADVLALAASPTHRSVFAAGADGQVIQFQLVDQSGRLSEDASISESIDIARGALGEKWVYVGGKRTHTHDVRALAIAFPVIDAGIPGRKQGKKWRVKSLDTVPSDHKRWARAETAMLISGGNDAKLFTYPASGFLSFHPHDVCPAPERPFIQLAHQSAIEGGTLMMAQHFTRVDIWKIFTNEEAALHSGNGKSNGNGHSVLGKRKWEGDSDEENLLEEPVSNGHTTSENGSKALVKYSNGHISKRFAENKPGGKNIGKAQGTPPVLLARIKCKSAEHIMCSAISGSGRLVAISDCQRPRLYELEQQVASADGAESEMWGIKRRKLPVVLGAAQCMVFNFDSSQLIVASPHGIIWVVDMKSTVVVHTFHTPLHDMDASMANAFIRIMCTSPDGQWLAAATSSGHIVVFNMEILRHQWTVPVLDGTPATSMVFHPGGNNVLIVSSAANQIHVLDVEMKTPGEWSKHNGTRFAKKLLDFPGGIMGLSLPPSLKSTSIIAYSSSAMCHIDFSKPIRDEVEESHKDPVEAGKEVHGNGNGNGKVCAHANGNGKLEKVSNSRSSSRTSNSFVVVPMKNPVLFLGHTGLSSVLVVEKPWLEVLREFPAPIFRHVYGS